MSMESPLAASSDNTMKPAVPGQNLLLTLDLPMQKRLEQILTDGAKRTNAESASAVILDPQTGAVKAMANVPTYDPAKYYES